MAYLVLVLLVLIPIGIWQQFNILTREGRTR